MNKNSINEVAKTYQRLVEAAPPMMLPEPMEDIDTFDPNVRSNDDFRRNVLQQLTFKDYTQFNNYYTALRQCYENLGSCSETQIAQYDEWIRQYLARLQYYQGQ